MKLIVHKKAPQNNVLRGLETGCKSLYIIEPTACLVLCCLLNQR
jgi:hypothetical protein